MNDSIMPYLLISALRCGGRNPSFPQARVLLKALSRKRWAFSAWEKCTRPSAFKALRRWHSLPLISLISKYGKLSFKQHERCWCLILDVWRHKFFIPPTSDWLHIALENCNRWLKSAVLPSLLPETVLLCHTPTNVWSNASCLLGMGKWGHYG